MNVLHARHNNASQTTERKAVLQYVRRVAFGDQEQISWICYISKCLMDIHIGR